LHRFIVQKICILLSLLSIVILATIPVKSANKIILRCADVQAPGYPTVEGILYMSRLVKEQTKGRIEIVVYPNSSLGPESSVVEMVKLGVLDMGRVSISQVVTSDPNLEVLLLPYIFKDNIHKWKVLDGSIGNSLLEGLSKTDLIGLCFLEAGYRSFYNTKRPIYSPEDLRGLKIRVQPSQIMIKMIEFLGAAAVPIDYNEVTPTLTAKAIDGAENNLPSFLSMGHYKVARYFSFDRHSSIPEVVLISKKIWTKLAASDQEIIRKAAKESVPYQRKLWDKFENDSYLNLQQEGCKFNEVDLAAFKQRFKFFYQMYAKKYLSMIDEINRVN
jgi:tripartite ATP-independent transporter DctP family solute receptor